MNPVQLKDMEMVSAQPGFRAMFVTNVVEDLDGSQKAEVAFADVAMWMFKNTDSNTPRVAPIIVGDYDGTYGVFEDATLVEGFVRVLGPNDAPAHFHADAIAVFDELNCVDDDDEENDEDDEEDDEGHDSNSEDKN